MYGLQTYKVNSPCGCFLKIGFRSLCCWRFLNESRLMDRSTLLRGKRMERRYHCSRGPSFFDKSMRSNRASLPLTKRNRSHSYQRIGIGWYDTIDTQRPRILLGFVVQVSNQSRRHWYALCFHVAFLERYWNLVGSSASFPF